VKAVFVELPAFARHREEYLDDEEFRELQETMLANPEAGDLMPGTGGLRKLRFADLALHPVRQGREERPDRNPEADTPRAGQGRARREEGTMTSRKKTTVARNRKRDLFAELEEGFEALAEERQGKRTLRTHKIELKAAPRITPRRIVALREELQLSRPLFAAYLRTNVRTLENWEQGRAKPNAQAALLIRLVERYPDTVQRLAAV
jgi:putative transcriptional regulator